MRVMSMVTPEKDGMTTSVMVADGIEYSIRPEPLGWPMLAAMSRLDRAPSMPMLSAVKPPPFCAARPATRISEIVVVKPCISSSPIRRSVRMVSSASERTAPEVAVHSGELSIQATKSFSIASLR